MNEIIKFRSLTPMGGGKPDLVPVSKGADFYIESGTLHTASVKKSSTYQYESKMRLAHKLGLEIPCSETDLYRFIEDIMGNYSYSSINSFVSAIKWAHKKGGYPTPTPSDLIPNVLRNLKARKKEAGEHRTKAMPLTYKKLFELDDFLSKDPLPIDSRNRVILYTMYFSSLRRSELAGLKYSSLRFTEGGVALFLGDTKNDKPDSFIPFNNSNPQRCAATILKHYVEKTLLNKPIDSPLFYGYARDGITPTGKGITPNTVNRIIKKVLKDSGDVFWRQYSGHSPRGGYVTDAVAAKAHLIDISDNARMSTRMVKDYASVASANATVDIIKNINDSDS